MGRIFTTITGTESCNYLRLVARSTVKHVHPFIGGPIMTPQNKLTILAIAINMAGSVMMQVHKSSGKFAVRPHLCLGVIRSAASRGRVSF